jgi:outer membrane protein assembly factor BamB
VGRRIVALAVLFLLLSLPVPAPPASAAAVHVSVLVDFGDGTYLWADVDVPDTNRTALKATELANTSWGLPPLEITWVDSPFCRRNPCAFVDDLGNRDPAYPVWWHFFAWNATAQTWDFAAMGPSDTDVVEGDSIAWYLAVDDPVTSAVPKPAPTPDFRDVWTSFRGDLDNRGEARGMIPVTGREEWSRGLCPGTDCWDMPLEMDAAPVVAYGMVFVVMRDWVVALDVNTGQTVWSNLSLGGLLSTPAVYDGRLVFGGPQGKIHAVDAFTGRELWNLLLEPGGRSTGIASSPTVYMGRAYVGTFNESAGGRGKVAAVNLHNGTIAWEYDAPGAIHMSSPAIRNGTLYVGVMGTYDGGVGYDAPHGLLALTLEGSLRWFFETDGPTAASPLLANGTAFVTDKAGNLYGIHEDGGLAWRRTIGGSTSSMALAGDRLFVGSGNFNGSGFANGSGIVHALDTAGNELWRAEVNGPVQASVVTDGRLVCGGTNVELGYHFCLSATDGAVVWRRFDFLSFSSFILGSSTAVGGTLFAVSDSGTIKAYRDANPAEYLLARPGISVEEPLRPGLHTELHVWVGADAAIYNVSLTVTVPQGLRLANETPSQANRSRTLRLNLGDLGLRGHLETLAVEALRPHTSWTVTASVSYRDFGDREYPAAETSETFSWNPGAPPPAPDLLIPASIFVGALAAVAFLVLVVRRRGRQKGGVSRNA